MRAAAALRHHDPHCRIVLVDGEDEDPYDEPPLSKAVLSSTTLPSLSLTDHIGQGIDYRRGTPAVAVDTAASTVSLSDGSVLRYDSTVLATGSAPRRLRRQRLQHRRRTTLRLVRRRPDAVRTRMGRARTHHQRRRGPHPHRPRPPPAHLDGIARMARRYRQRSSLGPRNTNRVRTNLAEYATQQ
ncbi:FAD-dependent oxidoreductase [Rhodococcus tibetensis]|uniref:FAD-dependent oxidoreductase n=1 Tax=Rhodococcus tibetensis TaxID=2965064 RepID=UPI0035AB9D01